MFIGGGTVSGTFREWTVPEFQGNNFTYGFYKYSLNAKGGGGSDDWGSRASSNITLSQDPAYSGHTNHSGENNPNHYTIEYWIKFR